jgi:N,N-dimethylformamidase beta subunit-like, C-terminal
VRAVVPLLATIALWNGGSGRSISLSTTLFAPSAGPLTINGQVDTPALLGVRLASVQGRVLGWIDPPARRSLVVDVWDGTLGGKPVANGYYEAQLVANGRVAASAGFRLDRKPALLDRLRVTSTTAPFAGDRPLLATVTPNGDGLRDHALVSFVLTEPAKVTLDVQRTVAGTNTIYTRTWGFRRGPQTIEWTPAPNVQARTYVLSLKTVDTAGNELVYGAPDARVGRYPRAPVVRLLGIDAAFARQSYDPGRLATLRIATDEPTMTMQVLRTGPERFVTYADNLLEGEAVTEPVTISWSRYRSAPHSITVRIGDWPSGLYFAKLTAPDRTIGYAPFVVLPATLGAAGRVAVVLPTNSWAAYNFYDADGDGWGDTWYAGPPHQSATTDRPYIHRGVPPFFYRYDQGFLHWLYWTGKTVDFLSESKVAETTGDELAQAYDLIVYSGHSEYVTAPEYDAIERYRDLGGNLMFLSSNNFFRRIDVDGALLRKIGQWRSLGRPEARLLGVQYLANDEGQRQGLYTVRNAQAAPWLWQRTGLADGSTFGEAVGGYGIEIDHTTPESPPGTIVLAEVPDLYGPGYTAQMSYYETPAGAKVFAAGTMDFGGSAITVPVSQVLENLWSLLTKP